MGSNPSGGVQQLVRNLSGSQKQTQGRGDPAVRRQQGTERMAGNGLIDDLNAKSRWWEGEENTPVTVAQIDHLTKGGEQAGFDHVCMCSSLDIPIEHIFLLLSVFFILDRYQTRRKLENKNLYYHCTGRYNLTAHPCVETKRVGLKPLGRGRSQSNTGERDQSDTHLFNRFTTPKNWTP